MENDEYVERGHFYSPIPDPEDALHQIERVERATFHDLPGIALSDETMLATWHRLLPEMIMAPFQAQAGPLQRYQWDNFAYPPGDAFIYFGMIATERPKRIIEIGSGFSSAAALDARDALKLDIDITFIEPYPGVLNDVLQAGDLPNITIIEKKVQHVELDLFQALEAGDILFIDSSHVAKVGSDVCYEIFEILPALKPGVLVQIHDVLYPFEYPRAWVIDQKRAWNELYVLRAFLMYNPAFEIVFFNDYFAKRFPREAADPSVPFSLGTGGGIWLRRR